jgi:polyisoprenoid-binding protein YceI|tara:strand:- start:316 stop:882 length:567 start_codon:yes stop_codon:yes gene_type:complete
MLTLIRLTLIALLLPIAAQAKPIAYQLNPSKSDVAFLYEFEGTKVKGSFPNFTTDVTLDFEQLDKSSINVNLQTGTVKGGFVFATQVLRGPKMLDAGRFPAIKFESTKLTQNGDQAQLFGNITVKDVTRPITLNARIFRTAGSATDDRDNLVVRLTGEINRSDFGVDGFKSYVGDILKLAITVQIEKK